MNIPPLHDSITFRLRFGCAWAPWAEARRQVAVLQAYRRDPLDLIPDEEPVIGLLDARY
jgi:uncharacterized membrane protein YkvA (DUF1232 family)